VATCLGIVLGLAATRIPLLEECGVGPPLLAGRVGDLPQVGRG
jgi:hypothetical protein